MADQDKQEGKLKVKRSMIYIIMPILLIATIAMLFITKGRDLGAEKSQKAKDDAALQEREKQFSAREEDPQKSSENAMNRAVQSAKSEEDLQNSIKRMNDLKNAKPFKEGAVEVPPPSSGLPPAVGEVDPLRESQLERARVVLGHGLDDKQKQDTGLGSTKPTEESKSSFVIYTAEAKPGSNLGTAAVNQLKYEGSNTTTTEQTTTATPTVPRDNLNLTSGDDTVKKQEIATAAKITGTHWLSGGTIIPAVIIGAVDTANSGQITAKVTSPVFDSRYGKYVVIPSGSILRGEVASDVANGQSRIVMSFNTLTTPSGGTINLPKAQGADQLAVNGVPGELHTHFWSRMGYATLMAFEAVGMERLSNRQTSVNSGTGTTMTTNNTSAGAQIIANAANKEYSMRMQGPNITIDAGAQVSVVTTADMELPPIVNER